jgi:hypothetical protein
LPISCTARSYTTSDLPYETRAIKALPPDYRNP